MTDIEMYDELMKIFDDEIKKENARLKKKYSKKS